METNSDIILYPYGILEEQSDIRVHVCPVVRKVYVYPTEEGRKTVMSGKWPKRSAYQPGVVGPTAEGFLVPPSAIARCVGLEIRQEAWDFIKLSEGQNTSTKGQKAVQLIVGMLCQGILPLPRLASANSNPIKSMQIAGDDIIVELGACRVHIQVKCDFRGGDKALGGTGNLFLQVAERNPLKQI